MSSSKALLLTLLAILSLTVFSSTHQLNTKEHNEKNINVAHLGRQSQNHKLQSHRLNGQECIKQKGYVCGTFIQDCCKEGCYKSWFLGPQTCLNNNFLTIQQNKCEDLCKQKGGILCSNILQDPQCCPESACTKGLTNKCNANQKVNITGCYQGNLMDSITGIFKS